MIGVLLLSHGQMANGMYDTIKLFFGDALPGFHAECLLENDSIENFDERIKNALEKLDDGSGVIVLCDLFGGTPNNRCAFFMNDKVRVISGINLSLLIELLGMRGSYNDVTEIDIHTLIETAKNSIVYLNPLFENTTKNKK